MAGQRKTGRNAPHKWLKLPHGHNSGIFSLSCAHVSVHMYCTLFPPNKHFTHFTTFPLRGNSFLQSGRPGPLLLTTGLVGSGAFIAMT